MPETLLTRLTQRLGSNNVLLGDDIGERYFGDWSKLNPKRPAALLRPSSTDDLAFIMSVCYESKQAVVIQGGMTGLCAGATPQNDEIAVSMERMNGILEIDEDSMTMTVLAGTPLEKIQEAANRSGYSFPLDLGARGSCTIGGNIATNAGGNQVIRFGMTRALVLGLEVVLPDGTIITSLNKMLKNNAGYDLKHLFIGTEGTLGIISKAVLRIFPESTPSSTAFCALDSLEDTIQLLRHLNKRLGSGLSAFEVMWSDYIDYALENVSEIRVPIDNHFSHYVLIEFDGAEPETESTFFQDALSDSLEAGILKDVVIAKSQKEVSDFWRVRDVIGDIFTQLAHAISFDISAPIGTISNMLQTITSELRLAFPAITQLTYGHLGDSNIHLTVTTGDGEDLKMITEVVYRNTGVFGGSISGEHGIGVLKNKYLCLSRSENEIKLMQQLKSLIDPTGILNPGRVLP